VCKATLAHARRNQLKSTAASLAYTTVLSLIPMLALVFFAVKHMGLLDSGYAHFKPWILGNLAPGAGDAVNQNIMGFLKNSKLSKMGWAGFLGFLITAVLTVNQFNDALNRVLETPDERKLLRRAGKNAVIIATMPVLLSASLGVSAFLPLKGLPITLIIDSAAFAMAYGFLPRRRSNPKALLITSAVMASIWEATKTGYSLYARRATNYSRIYGPLAAVPVFFVWVYVAWFVVLLGAALLKVLNERLTPRRKT
jgi:membrane protein